ncbi:enoyl-CoA hydratase/isomerase family protein [Thermodesulfobacteriota bacterium]
MESYKYVLYEKQDRVAIITLNRPEKKNALNAELRRDMLAAFRAAEEDEGIRAVIITGAGGVWSAGADMTPSAGKAPTHTVEEWMLVKRQLFLDQLWVRNMSKPTISAVEGYCLGAAFEWCLNMDMIIAAQSARFGGPELHQGSIQLTRLPYYVGFQMAKKMYLTGDMITGKEAERIGLVMECVPDEKLMETALKLAKRISQNSPQAIMFNKWMIDSVADSMGWMDALSQGSRWDAIGHAVSHHPHTETAGLFKISKEKGVREFIKAREEKFPPEEVADGMVYR